MLSTKHQEKWIKYFKPEPLAHYSLFCFPYAGGGASIYRTWSEELSPIIEVIPIQLPGRENRISEKLNTHLNELVSELAEVIIPYINKPFAIFGHSMGALISFELARKLQNVYNVIPSHLFVSAFCPPQLLSFESYIHQLPDNEFLSKLKHLNGTPKEIIENSEALALHVPILKADVSLVGTYRYYQDKLLSMPITAFGGLDDSAVNQILLRAWGEHTSNAFSLQMIHGDHFFINSMRQSLLTAISQSLL